jgi:hypothetical protein
LLEPFDLAAGGGVVGPGVLLVHVEPAKLVFEGIAAAFAAGVAGGEHRPVVGQGGRRDPMGGNGSAEAGEHDRSGDPQVRGHSQGVAGVVVQPGQDLAVDAAGQPVVGEVGLPSLIWQGGLEAHIGGLGPFGGLRNDQTGLGQLTADGGR